MSKDTGGPAFPAIVADPSGYGEGFFIGETPSGSRQFLNTFPGMTLRDWFAGQALEGFCKDPASDDATPEEIAHAAYRIADAMLAERSKE